MTTIPRPCLTCGTPTTLGPRCPECARPIDRARDARRAARRPDLRSHRWRKTSERARKRQPFCGICGSPDRLEVHHSVSPLDGGPAIPALDGVEAEVLCQRCHQREHRKKSESDSQNQGGHPVDLGVLDPRGRDQDDYSPLGGDVDPEGSA
ncbi:MAG: HNH endonuclease [Iamia sp.]